MCQVRDLLHIRLSALSSGLNSALAWSLHAVVDAPISTALLVMTVTDTRLGPAISTVRAGSAGLLGLWRPLDAEIILQLSGAACQLCIIVTTALLERKLR